MKTTFMLGLCVVTMSFGASVSWTRQPVRERPSAATSRAAASRPAASRPTTREVPKIADVALRGLVEQGIKQLKAKEYEAFLQRFISPADQARIFRRMTLKELAPRFGQYKAPILLAALTWSLQHQPKVSTDGSRVVFSLKGLRTPTPKRSLIFVKIKGLWYIKD